MENVWNGAFSPTLSKSIGTATFIPLYKMTKEHWRLLDWDILSNNAKNNIVQSALEDQIAGFILFKFVQKGSRHGGYLQPVQISEIDSLDSLMSKPTFSNYGLNEDKLTESAVRFDRALTGVADAATLLGLAGLAGVIVKDYRSEPNAQKEVEQYLQEIVNGDINDLEELDVCLTFAFSVLADHDIEWLEEWAQEAEQIIGEKEDSGKQ